MRKSNLRLLFVLLGLGGIVFSCQLPNKKSLLPESYAQKSLKNRIKTVYIAIQLNQNLKADISKIKYVSHFAFMYRAIRDVEILTGQEPPYECFDIGNDVFIVLPNNDCKPKIDKYYKDLLKKRYKLLSIDTVFYEKNILLFDNDIEKRLSAYDEDEPYTKKDFIFYNTKKNSFRPSFYFSLQPYERLYFYIKYKNSFTKFDRKVIERDLRHIFRDFDRRKKDLWATW